MTEIVAVIPARGGSKGIPRKNLQRVGGAPLVARAVAAARATASIDRVIVSTDDPEIAAVAEEWGAHVITRPAALADDHTSSEAVLLHALDVLEDSGVEVGILAFLQATSPFIDPADLDGAIARVLDGESDVVFSAKATHAFLWRVGDDGASGINHDASFRLRRQDSEPQFQETGAFYVMRADGFREAGFRFFGRVGVALVPELTAMEIDSADDLRLARAIAATVAAPERIDVDAVVTDFDGVHTDDRVHVGADGSEFVTASRSDGMGVELLRKAGIPLLIISKETNPVVRVRAQKLKVEVRQSVDNKGAVLSQWAADHGVELSRIAYLGNDVNDLGCLALVGWPIAVADAHPDVLAVARVVLTAKGGHGAVRELADRVLAPVVSAAQSATTQEESWSPSARTR
jgi:N-acylneuraminate cytidylyltransferase